MRGMNTPVVAAAAAGLLAVVVGGAIAAGAPAPLPRVLHVDHLILGTRDLDEGMRQFEERTGVRPMVGGVHPGRGTRNALVSIGPGLYIEILAPQAGEPDGPGAEDLKALADLTPMGWAVGVRDLLTARERLIGAGFGLTDVMPGARARPDGSRLSWQTFAIEKPAMAGVPFFIRWGDETSHPSQDAPAGCRLDSLRIVSPDASDLRRALDALPLKLPLEKGARPAMEVALRCPKGTVRFAGAPRPLP
jgi:hypothetical protein